MFVLNQDTQLKMNVVATYLYHQHFRLSPCQSSVSSFARKVDTMFADMAHPLPSPLEVTVHDLSSFNIIVAMSLRTTTPHSLPLRLQRIFDNPLSLHGVREDTSRSFINSTSCGVLLC